MFNQSNVHKQTHVTTRATNILWTNNDGVVPAPKNRCGSRLVIDFEQPETLNKNQNS